MKTFEKMERYGIFKVNYPFIKAFALALMAGIFIGLGYVGFIKVYTANENGVTLFLGSIAFTAGIAMCMLVGGTLYTSNNLIFAGVITGKVRLRDFAKNLTIIFLGNYLGAIILALIIWGLNQNQHLFFGAPDSEGFNNVIGVINKKVNYEWWQTILSGILTNILVVAVVIVVINFDNHPGAWFTACILFIAIFAIAGYQHIVANQFLLTLGFLLHSDAHTLTNDFILRAFCHCLIPTLIGNTLGGLFMVYIYYLITGKRSIRLKIDTPSSLGKPEEANLPQDYSNNVWYHNLFKKIPSDLKMQLKKQKYSKLFHSNKECMEWYYNEKIARFDIKKQALEKNIALTKDQTYIQKAKVKITTYNQKITDLKDKSKYQVAKLAKRYYQN